MRAAEILGPNGAFSGGLARYEPRAGQQRMAESVQRNLAEGGLALIEAGTGTGKTFAYLVPALLEASDRRIVISTSTRALQDQLFFKDLPVAQQLVGSARRTALLKGLSNYVCRRRLHEFRASGELLEGRWGKSLPIVQPWLDRTQTGAVDELPTVQEGDPLVARLTASPESRVGSSCEFFETCYVTRAKREAAGAQIVVVNHHLFFADLSVRGAHPGSVLPDYDAVIFDEAHQLEEVATHYFGRRVSTGKLQRLTRDARVLLQRRGESAATVLEMAVERESVALFNSLHPRGRQPGEGRTLLRDDAWAGAAQACWFSLDTSLESLGFAFDRAANAQLDEGPGPTEGNEDLYSLQRRVRALRDDLASIVEGSGQSVGWVESTSRGQAVGTSPVDVSEHLQTRLFDVVPSVVLTSATLATHGAASQEGEGRSAFEYTRSRFGLNSTTQRVEELVLESPFDFAAQALLYLPRDLPFPDKEEFPEAFAGRSAELIEQADGGAFVLTTSIRAMQSVAKRLRQNMGSRRRVLVQGQAPKSVLLDRFRSSGKDVLVATLSFWQGVDVPGSALRLVILEKTPFPVPTEPLVHARSEALRSQGQSSFSQLHLPLALLTLKQGFGRLIRTQSDVGVVALLDTRLHARNYGNRLVDGLPSAQRVADLAEVGRFWLRQRQGFVPEETKP